MRSRQPATGLLGTRTLVGIGLLTACLLLAGVPSSAEDEGDEVKNIVAIHDSSTSPYDKHCNDCHGDVHTAQSMDPAIPAAHVAMFPFAPGKPGEDKQCVWCHQSVDLTAGTQSEEKTTGNLRKRVDATACVLCHGSEGPGTQFYQVAFSSFQFDGAELYDLTCAGCHKHLAESKVRGKELGELQKAIEKDKGGMGPLNVLTTEELEAIAAVLAEVDGREDDD
jgi:hypothetical protein